MLNMLVSRGVGVGFPVLEQVASLACIMGYTVDRYLPWRWEPFQGFSSCRGSTFQQPAGSLTPFLTATPSIQSLVGQP